MPSKANDFDAAMIERGAYFQVSLFLGVGQFHTEDFPTIRSPRGRH